MRKGDMVLESKQESEERVSKEVTQVVATHERERIHLVLPDRLLVVQPTVHVLFLEVF